MTSQKIREQCGLLRRWFWFHMHSRTYERANYLKETQTFEKLKVLTILEETKPQILRDTKYPENAGFE